MITRASAIRDHSGKSSGRLSISDRGPTDMHVISAWRDCAEEAISLLGRSGLSLTSNVGLVGVSATGVAMTIGPGRWLVEASERLRLQLPAEIGAATDLGHARTSFLIKGSVAPDLIQKLSPVDLLLEQYGPARVWQGGNAHSIAHTIYRRLTDEFIIYVERSYALDFVEKLEEEAAEFRTAE